MGEKVDKSSKNNEAEKKSDGGVNSIILKFDMHCEGCAKKIRKSIMKFQGVESVKTDLSTNKLVVTGKVDPVQVKERVEEKMKKKVESVSLQPTKPSKENGKDGGGGSANGNGNGSGNGSGNGGDKKKSDDKKPEEKKSDGKPDDSKKSEDNKVKEKPKEPIAATVQLKTKVHCEGCAQKIKKIVGRCEGVQDVNVDLQKDLITAKGTMNMKDLLPYLNVKLKRSVELVPPAKDKNAGGDKKPKESGGGGPDKPKEGGAKSEKPPKSDNEKKDNSANNKKNSGSDKKDCDCNKKDGGGEKKKGAVGDEAGTSKDNNGPKIEVNKMEYNPYGYDQSYSYAFDPRHQGEGYDHQVVEYWHAPEYSQPPQLFSDENPNACSIM